MKAWDIRWLVVSCLIGAPCAKAAPLMSFDEVAAAADGKKRNPKPISAEDALASLTPTQWNEPDANLAPLPATSLYDTPSLTEPKVAAEEAGPADPTVDTADDFRNLPAIAPSLGNNAATTRYPELANPPTTRAKKSKSKKEEFAVKAYIFGVQGELADTLIDYLPSRRRLACNTDAERIDRFIASSQPKLQEGAEAMGYFDAQFNMSSARQNNCWVFNIQVTPGLPIRVVGQDIKIAGAGKNLKDFREIEAKKPYVVGEVLVHKPYEDYKTSLNQKSSQLGFFDADYKTKQLQIDPDKREGKVVLDYNTGERYRIGSVDVQQDVLNPEVLQRHIRVRAGDYYNSEDLLKMQRVLEASKYYKDVQVVPQHDAAKNRQIPVTVKAERNKRYSYTGKLGYGADTKTRFEAKMDTHWVNDKGHKLTVEGVASKPESSIGATYKVPLWQPENEYAALSAGWSSSNANGIKSSGLKGEFSYNRRSDNDWQQTAYINTRHETTETDGAATTKSTLTLLGARVKKTKADDLLTPTQGWQVGAELQGAVKGVLSDQTLLQGKVNGKYLKTLSSKNKIITQGALGTTFKGNLTDMPKSLRYFAGGQNSVRGYDFESLGTQDTDGVVIGGKHILTASSEYEHFLTDKISVAGFVDAGNAFEDWKNYKLKWGLGAGVRYQTPIGPIRADIAVPKNDTKDVHFYFSLGPDL